MAVLLRAKIKSPLCTLGPIYMYSDSLVNILLKTVTQTIDTKTPKTYSKCGYFVNGYLSGYSINAHIDRFRVNKL